MLKKTILSLIIIIALFITNNYILNNDREVIKLGKWTKNEINLMLAEAKSLESQSKRIEHISELFLDTPYKSNTLIGNEETREKLVINLTWMDCFTYLDYVLALSISDDFKSFKKNLKKIRYEDGKVKFKKRNHFFTDWIENNVDLVKDITTEIGREEKLIKRLSIKGLETFAREVSYIPAKKLNERKLQTGDFIGYYSEDPNLDVSHVGIVIIKKDGAYIRNASSWKSSMKVEDHKLSALIDYGEIPGFIVFRKTNHQKQRI